MKFSATARTDLMGTTVKRMLTSVRKALAKMEEHVKKDTGPSLPANAPISTQEINVKHLSVQKTTATMVPVTKLPILYPVTASLDT